MGDHLGFHVRNAVGIYNSLVESRREDMKPEEVGPRIAKIGQVDIEELFGRGRRERVVPYRFASWGVLVDGLHLKPKETAKITHNESHKSVERGIRILHGWALEERADKEGLNGDKYLLRKNIPHENVRIVLNALLKISKDPELDMREVVTRISEYCGVDEERIMGRSRPELVVLCRQGAQYILRERFGLGFNEIAERTGRNDHTTAIHGVNRIRSYLKQFTSL